MKIPPIAEQKPHEYTIHGKRHVDEYWWMQDKTKPEVQAYLKEENRYATAFMRPQKKLVNTLYKEIRSRIKEDDSSVPVKDGPYDYYSRTKKGKQYAIHCRREGEKGRETVILDENVLAKGQKYFSLGDAEASPDHRLLAYTTDITGNEDHTLYIKRLDTGELLQEKVTHVADFVWAEDNQHIFYSLEEHPYPPRKVFRHKIGDEQSKDILIYEEADPQWYVALGKSRSRQYIFLYAANYLTTEVRFIPAREPLREPKLIAARKPKVRYYVEHHGAYFYITSNENAVNYKVLRTLVQKPDAKNWKTWLPHDANRSVIGIYAFLSFLAFTFREGGSEEIHIYHPETEKWEHVVLPEAEHSIGINDGIDFASTYIRLGYESMITPKTVYDYYVTEKKFVVRKEQEVPKYTKEEYVSKRIWVKSGGVEVPAVIVHKKGVAKKAPLLLEAYGSYGITHDPHFSLARLSLLERGFVYVLAHPRGGGEMGWNWHKQAYLTTKHRTADDFIAVAEKLIADGYTAPEKLAITGGSAGGMLMGMVMNMRPDLFGAAVVYVPAADLVTTLMDESIAGTRLHFDEIGNPKIKKQYDAIKRISPYENVRAVEYPTTLVRASVHDIRTPYWEAAKWVARLRAMKKGSQPLLFKCELAGGHFGKSGRYEWIKERAFDYAFLISTLAQK